ncbi:MAG: helix-turn-helix protein [Acidimicrobiia bacterium]|nr:helix-turn-helix protein [Acidimicrobiia bacterium]
MDVVLLRWPSESERRDRLSESGVARLLLVEPGEPLPPVVDELEDWVRVPADEVEVQARVSTLSARARAGVTSVPTLDGDGVVRMGDAWTSLPPVEARLLEALLGRFGSVVSRGSLAESGWPDGAPGRNALDVHMLRLRRRLGPLGLAIRTIRSRGYLLERSDSSQQLERNA